MRKSKVLRDMEGKKVPDGAFVSPFWLPQVNAVVGKGENAIGVSSWFDRSKERGFWCFRASKTPMFFNPFNTLLGFQYWVTRLQIIFHNCCSWPQKLTPQSHLLLCAVFGGLWNKVWLHRRPTNKSTRKTW